MIPQDIEIWLLGSSLLVTLLLLLIVIVVVLMNRRGLQKKRSYVQSLIDEKEKLMYSISLELHDNIAQRMYGQIFELKILEQKLADVHKDQLRKQILAMEEIVDLIRALSHSLNADYLVAKRLPEAIEEKLRIVSSMGAFETAFHISGTYTVLPHDTELVVYRIVQEALSNAIRHSKAIRIEVTFIFELNDLQVLIKDNGQGFDRLRMKAPAGIGLLNMKRRAALIYSDLEISSKRDEGTCVSLFIPNAFKKRNEVSLKIENVF